MNFTIKKNDLLNILAKVQGIAGRKTNLAITTNILIEAADTNIVIKATDLETGFEGHFPAKVESKGTVALNARKMFEIVRDFPSEDIHINEIENNWIEIGNQNIEYHLVGMKFEDFPKIPLFDDLTTISLDSAALSSMIERTVYISGASDDKRAHIIGVYMETIQEKGRSILRMVSTDGSRLAKADHSFEGEFSLPAGEGILIPKKGLYEVVKFLDQGSSIRIGVKDNNLVIKKQAETIIIRLLEGDFPEYKDIIHKNEESIALKLNRQLFLMMLKRMSILSTEDYRSVIFNFMKEKLVITSTNPDIGESKEDMKIEFNHDKIEVAFNPRYFIEALNVIDNEMIFLHITNDEMPCILTGEDDQDFITVIMPMRV